MKCRPANAGQNARSIICVLARRNYREYLLGRNGIESLTCCAPCWQRCGLSKGAAWLKMPFLELLDAIVTDSDLLGAIDQLCLPSSVQQREPEPWIELFRSSMPSLMPNFRGWKPSC